MNFTYPEAPISKIDGVPAYAAGEWPGIKSNKFERIRKVIRPVDQEQIVFGSQSFKQHANKRHYPERLSKELEYRRSKRESSRSYLKSDE